MDRARTVLITGATGGLGGATARALAARGWHVVVGGRDRARVDAVVAGLDRTGPAGASGFVADLGDLSAVRAGVDDLLGRVTVLDAVVANAGLTLAGRSTSADGYELTFAVNVLAHQLLLARLAGSLPPRARVVVVASGVHLPEHRLARATGVRAPRWVGAEALARPDHRDHLPVGTVRYSTSKLGDVLLARALQERLRAAGRDVDVFALDPGLMLETDLARQAPRPVRAVVSRLGPVLSRAVPGVRRQETSAAHVADLVSATRWSGRGFAYLDGDRERPPSRDALRDDLADGLWTDGARLVGLRQDETVLALG